MHIAYARGFRQIPEHTDFPAFLWIVYVCYMRIAYDIYSCHVPLLGDDNMS